VTENGAIEGENGLARYLRETGTRSSWLAQRLGVSESKMCRWISGATGMREGDKLALVAVLRERAALSLDGLLDDVADFHQRTPASPRPRAHVGGTPYERFLAERPLVDVVEDLTGERAG
jgi:hypothetical protein